MCHLLYLMFRCDVDVVESLELGGVFWELNTAHVKFSREIAPHDTVQELMKKNERLASHTSLTLKTPPDHHSIPAAALPKPLFLHAVHPFGFLPSLCSSHGLLHSSYIGLCMVRDGSPWMHMHCSIGVDECPQPQVF